MGAAGAGTDPAQRKIRLSRPDSYGSATGLSSTCQRFGWPPRRSLASLAGRLLSSLLHLLLARRRQVLEQASLRPLCLAIREFGHATEQASLVPVSAVWRKTLTLSEERHRARNGAYGDVGTGMGAPPRRRRERASGSYQTLATERAMRLASMAISRSIPVGETWKPQK